MIRLAERQDLDRIMEIWLEGNLQAHDFVDPDYWTGCLQEVREAIAQADVWVWDENDRVEAFAGMVEHYLAGLFVSGAQRGKGIGGLLLEHIKEQRFPLTLHVYSGMPAQCSSMNGMALEPFRSILIRKPVSRNGR